MGLIIAKTPHRISFFGGGTDLPAFTEREDGAALTATISVYNHVIINQTKGPIRFIHEDINGPEGMRNEIARAIIHRYELFDGYDIASLSDVHAVGAGLGGSSAFTVGVLQAIHALQGEYRTAYELAKEACEIEIDVCGYPIGVQDQFQIAFGGLNLWSFPNNGLLAQRTNWWDEEVSARLSSHMVLLYSGFQRKKTAGAILQNQQAAMRTDAYAFKSMQWIKKRVEIAENILVWSHEPFMMQQFGELLHDNWMDKKRLTKDLDNPDFDEFYDVGLKLGAIGGKLLGAGGGGFFLFFLPYPEQTEAFANCMVQKFPKAKHYPFQITHKGSEVSTT